MRRTSNKNKVDNAWKQLNRQQKNKVASTVNRAIATNARSGQSFRNGQIESGAIQLFNLGTTDYITFGANNGGGTTVGP